jgi:hypothetical protein
MWKVVALLLGLMGSPVVAHEIEDACSVDVVYEQVIIAITSQVGTPRTAEFPTLDKVAVIQEGSECRFTFVFPLRTTNVNGEQITENVSATGFRVWNSTWQKLGRINVEFLR